MSGECDAVRARFVRLDVVVRNGARGVADGRRIPMQELETTVTPIGPEEPVAEATTDAAMPRSEVRYPLAFDANGNPVRLPPEAVAWRVRRGGGKRGRPRNVFDAGTGRQLEIALGASIEDLAETNVPADRYLLYPVDAQGNIIPGLVAVTEVTDDEDDRDDDVAKESAAVSVSTKDPTQLLAASQQETIRGQQEVIRLQSEQLARALGSAVSGYAPVRPYAPPAPPPPQQIVMEQPAPPPPPPDNGGGLLGLLNMKPEQMMQLVMMAKGMFDMVKGAPPIVPPVGTTP